MQCVPQKFLGHHGGSENRLRRDGTAWMGLGSAGGSDAGDQLATGGTPPRAVPDQPVATRPPPDGRKLRSIVPPIPLTDHRDGTVRSLDQPSLKTVTLNPESTYNTKPDTTTSFQQSAKIGRIARVSGAARVCSTPPARTVDTSTDVLVFFDSGRFGFLSGEATGGGLGHWDWSFFRAASPRH